MIADKLRLFAISAVREGAAEKMSKIGQYVISFCVVVWGWSATVTRVSVCLCVFVSVCLRVCMSVCLCVCLSSTGKCECFSLYHRVGHAISRVWICLWLGLALYWLALPLAQPRAIRVWLCLWLILTLYASGSGGLTFRALGTKGPEGLMGCAKRRRPGPPGPPSGAKRRPLKRREAPPVGSARSAVRRAVSEPANNHKSQASKLWQKLLPEKLLPDRVRWCVST